MEINSISAGSLKTVGKWLLVGVLVFAGISLLFTSPLAGIPLLVAVAILYPKVADFIQSKVSFNFSPAVKTISVIILVSLAMAVLPETKTTPDALQATQPAPTPQTLEEKVSAAVTATLGEKNNTDKTRIVAIETTPYSSSELAGYGYSATQKVSSMWIKINASENLTTNLQKGAMHGEASKIFQNVFSVSPEIGDVLVWSYLPTKDKYGNTSDSVAIVYSMSRNLSAKINWTNFNHRDLPDLLKSESNSDDRNSYVERIKF